MFKKIALLVLGSTMAYGFSATALADAGSAMRVVVVKTEDVSNYVREIDKGKQILKRLGIAVQTHVWRATFAGPNTGTIVVSQEYVNNAGMMEGMAKVNADPEYNQWLKGLDKVRTIVSDSLYQGLN